MSREGGFEVPRATARKLAEGAGRSESAIVVGNRAGIIEWANDCSKPRIDGFGGGAVVISRLGIDYINTNVWVQQISKLVGRRLTEERAA